MGKPFKKVYHQLLFSFMSSNFADGISLVLFPLLASKLTTSPFLVSLSDVFRQLPWLIIALPCGVLVDRYDKKNLAAIANGGRFLIILSLSFLYFYQYLSIHTLLFLGFFIGVCEVIFDTSVPSLLPTIVPKDFLNRANGELIAVETFTNYLLGRILAGVLAYTPFLSSLLNAFMYGFSAIMLKRISIEDKKSNSLAPLSFWPGVKEGLSIILNNQNLKILSLLGLIGNMAFGAIFGTLILFVTKKLQGSELIYGAIYGAFAVGAVLCGIKVDSFIKKFGDYRCLLTSLVVITCSFFCIPLNLVAFWTGLCFFFCGIAATLWNTVSIAYRQSVVPSHLLGRATSIFRLVSWGGMPLGSFLGGLCSEFFGLESPYYIFGCFNLVNILLACFFLNSKELQEKNMIDSLSTLSLKAS